MDYSIKLTIELKCELVALFNVYWVAWVIHFQLIKKDLLVRKESRSTSLKVSSIADDNDYKIELQV